MLSMAERTHSQLSTAGLLFSKEAFPGPGDFSSRVVGRYPGQGGTVFELQLVPGAAFSYAVVTIGSIRKACS